MVPQTQVSGRPDVGDPDFLVADAAWAPGRSPGSDDDGFDEFDTDDEDDEDDDFWRDGIGLLA